MLNRIRVAVLAIVFTGAFVTGPAGMADGREAVKSDLLLACSHSCCSSSQGHEMGHREGNQQKTSQNGAVQHAESSSGALQSRALAAPPPGGKQTDERLASKSQESCPVLGMKVDRSVYVDYEGKRVYFCCPACIARFKEDPARQIREIEAKGISLESTPRRQKDQIR